MLDVFAFFKINKIWSINGQVRCRARVWHPSFGLPTVCAVTEAIQVAAITAIQT